MAWGSVNWNWPGATSTTLPTASQLLSGKARFVVLSAVKLTPGTFVNVAVNVPFVSTTQSMGVRGCMATATTTTALVTLP